MPRKYSALKKRRNCAINSVQLQFTKSLPPFYAKKKKEENEKNTVF